MFDEPSAIIGLLETYGVAALTLLAVVLSAAAWIRADSQQKKELAQSNDKLASLVGQFNDKLEDVHERFEDFMRHQHERELKDKERYYSLLIKYHRLETAFRLFRKYPKVFIEEHSPDSD